MLYDQNSEIQPAMEIMDAEQPEIVLGDISMPHISGLELAKQVRKKYPQTIIILITGYSRFEYARQGIDVKAFEYILKPIDREKILDSIGRACSYYQENRRRTEKLELVERYFSDHYSRLQQQFLESLLFEPLPSAQVLQNQQQLFGIQFSHMYLAAFQISPGITVKPEEAYYNTHLIHRCICEKLCLIAHFSGSIVYVLIPQSRENGIVEEIRRILTEVEGVSENPVHAGVSRCFSELTVVQQMRRQAELCLETLKESHQSEALFCDDMHTFSTETISISILFFQLTNALCIGNAAAACEHMDAIIESTQYLGEEQKHSSVQMIISTLLFNIPDIGNPLNRLRAEASEIAAGRHALQSFARIRVWIQEACEAVQEWKIQQNNRLADQLCQFISEHFAEPIGLNEAAAFVNRNSSYVIQIVLITATTAIMLDFDSLRY